LAQIHLGEALLLAGGREQALVLARSGLALARERGHRGYEAWAPRLLGHIAFPDGLTTESAENYYRDGLALAAELAMHPLTAHCHLGLGKLHRRTGARQEAHEHLTTATTLYRAMDMRFWLEQAEAEAELRELG
jgi:hypothetical protein